MWNKRVSLIVAAVVLGLALSQAGRAELVAWWKLDGTCDDASGNKHHGTPLGDPTFVEGVYGQAVQLTGTPQYIDCGPGVSFRTVGDGGTAKGLSVAFWVNRAAAGDQKIISDIDNTNWDAAGGFKAAIYNDRLEPDIRDSRGRFWSRDTTQPAMELNRWYHCAYVLDDVADTYTEYIDGALLRLVVGVTQGLAPSTVNLYIGRDTPRDTGYVVGMLDDVRVYNHPLSVQEVQDAMAGIGPEIGPARRPNPEDGAFHVYRDAVLSWTPGVFAVRHDVYFGTVLEDVANATRANPLNVLVAKNQDANTYDPEGLLALGQTYYWRVDEVNDADPVGLWKGKIWSFTSESVALPIDQITVTASSFDSAQPPENTINRSGLENDLHNNAGAAMWLTKTGAGKPAWIQYDFNRVYKLQETQVWNYNAQFENLLGYGCKDVTIEYTANGTDWLVLQSLQLPRAPGQAGYAGLTIPCGGVGAKSVKITIDSGWGTKGRYGLSEVRFLHIPVFAKDPRPVIGAANISLDAVLGWHAGREAVSHKVYLGADPNAVLGGTAPVAEVAGTTYDPPDLALGTTYYWKVDEVNLAEAASTWQGDLWDFTTVANLTIDDFESYTNDSPNRVFQTWIDGGGFSADSFFPNGNPGNGTGALVGYDPLAGDIMETAAFHSGLQSMPLSYDNSGGGSVSEAQRTWSTAQDWTVGAADTLTVCYRGYPLGLVENAPDNFTISGIGTDIFGTADQFRFVYKQLTGDGSIVVRVDSLIDVDPFSLAGVMIRESADPASSYAGVFLTGTNGVRFRTRVGSASAATSDTAVATAEQIALVEPVWIKLERVGNQMSASYATDAAGTAWTAMSWSPQTVAMPVGPICIGLAVCSHLAGTPTVARFANITTSSSVSGQWQTAAIGIAQPSNTPDQLYVSLADKAGHAKSVPADADAVFQSTWKEWSIPFSSFAGVDMSRVTTMTIGVGSRGNPQHGSGAILIDDIMIGRPPAAQ
jgi:hypothetical protein